LIWLGGVALGWGAVRLEVRSLDKLAPEELSDWGRLALELSPAKWQHAETEHFWIHYRKRGETVARLCEKHYETIREFFGNRPDRLGGRKSRVFAFADAADWGAFAEKIGQPWVVGITRGNEFFYLMTDEKGRVDTQGRTQAHELTHLVFHRFFDGDVPLWLNEGIAEYFGQRETSTLTEFRQRMGSSPPYHLGKLMGAEKYPARPEDVQAFYTEAAIVVDFLTRTQERRLLLPRFVDALLAGQSVEQALKLYGFQNWAEFEKEYKKYRRRF
jgi:hypothetical protein